MQSWSPQRQQRLLAVVIACAVIFVGDIVMLNVVGEMSDSLWLFVVPIALLLVPIIGIVAFLRLLDSRRTPSP